MTHEQDPPRLLQTRDAELSELLPGLQRARAQGPSDEQLARICAGVAVRASSAQSEPGAQGEPGAMNPTRSASTARVSGTGATKLLKLLLAGALIGGTAFYGTRALNRVPADRADRQVPAAATAAPEAATQAPAQTPTASQAQVPVPVELRDETPRVEHAPARRATSTAGTGPRRAPPAAEAQPNDIDAELALLKRARAEVRPSPARALALTAEHATRFAHGTLAEEREVIAIEALLVRGTRAAAQARARAFFASYPASAHGRRVRALLDENPGARPDSWRQTPGEVSR